MQTHLARGHFFAMAFDAILDKDWLNLFRKIDFVLSLAGDSDQQHSGGRNNASFIHDSKPWYSILALEESSRLQPSPVLSCKKNADPMGTL
jgi:hypothetical protein